MKFKRKESKEYFLLDTGVENIFINEYMTAAPGDYVKVYLFALMYAEVGENLSDEAMAKQLGLKPADIQKAWTYWADMGVVRKSRIDGSNQIEFVNLKEKLYGKNKGADAKPQTAAPAKMVLSDKSLQNMYKSIERIIGRMMNGTEMQEILSWINDYNAAPEIIVYAYSHCKGKNIDRSNYVGAVVKRWVDEGLNDVLAVEEFLARIDQRALLYKRVYKALGFIRNATEEEMKIMDRWFDDMGYDIERVLEACKKTSGISNPNINYVNKVLVNWYEEENGVAVNVDMTPKPVTAAEIQKYYMYLRNKAEDEAAERTREIYSVIPEIRSIEEQMDSFRRQMTKVYLSGADDKESKVKELQNSIKELNQEKAILMTENDFDLDYMGIRYKCDKCKDTGTNDEGGRCECYSLRAKEAEIWVRNSNLTKENN